ncbi:hypothetical protein [Methylocystis sp. S23]|jgi:hypothetical protein
MKSPNGFACTARFASPLLAALLLASAGMTGAKAGFFEELFGDGGETRAARSAPAPVPHARRRPPAGRLSYSIRANVAPKEARDRRQSVIRRPVEDAAAHESDGGTKPQKAVFCAAGLPARANPDSAEVRLHDGTLRAGDSIVTAGGILVFKGRAACPHSAADFVSLARSRLPAAKRNALESLEHTVQAGRAPFALAEKAAAPRVVSQNNR